MPEVNTKLATNLHHAKVATKEAPWWFAFVAKGVNEGVLLVAKLKIPTKEINEAKVACGGKEIYRGRCFGEDGELICEVGKAPPNTLERQVKGIIHRDTGMQLKVAFRVAHDLAQEDGESAELGGAPTASQTPPATGEQASPDEMARFTARLKALSPEIQRADAGTSPVSQEIKLRMSEASVFAHKHDFTQANGLLDLIEALLGQLSASPPPSPPPDTVKAALTKRLGDLTAPVKAALAGPNAARVHELLGAAKHALEGHDLIQAENIVAELEQLLGAPTDGSKVALAKAKLQWEQAKKMAHAQLTALHDAVISDFNDPETTSAAKKLDRILERFNEGLSDTVDALYNAADPAQQAALRDKVVKTSANYLAYVETDPLISHVQENPFVKVAVRPLLSLPLKNLQAQLAATEG